MRDTPRGGHGAAARVLPVEDEPRARNAIAEALDGAGLGSSGWPPALKRRSARGRHVQHGLRQQLLQPPVLLSERLRAPRVGDLHSAVPGPPAVEGRVADARFRHTAPATGIPAWCSFSAPMICPSVNPLLPVVRSL